MLNRLKLWLTSPEGKKYTGSVIRSALLVVSGYLLAKGLADKETADALTGSLATILINFLNALLTNPDLLVSLGLGGAAQWWSLKEKAAQFLPKSKKSK